MAKIMLEMRLIGGCDANQVNLDVGLRFHIRPDTRALRYVQSRYIKDMYGIYELRGGKFEAKRGFDEADYS